MINLRFLGTGTIGSVRPKNKLSKEYRRFPTLLIDEKILIDPSEDIFELEESFMLDGLFREAKDILITHSHLDHLSISAVERLASRGEIRVFASEQVCETLIGIRGVRLHAIRPFTKITIGKFEIIALPSNHITDIAGEPALNFLIRAEKTFFYGLDGAFINAEAFQILREIKLDLCILECALGLSDDISACVYHNNLSQVERIRKILISAKCADDGTKFIISHIPTAKRKNIHEELTEAIGDLPIKVAYDGYYIGI